MKVKMVIIAPDVQPNEFMLTLPTKIGRGHEATLKLVHPLISRVHCEFFEQDGQLMVRDMDSLNGTFVEQDRIAEDTPLESNATVVIGSVMVRLLIGDDADHMPPPRPGSRGAAAETVQQDTLNKLARNLETVTDDQLWESPEDDAAIAEEEGGAVAADDEGGAIDLDFDDEPDASPQPATPTPATPKAAPTGCEAAAACETCRAEKRATASRRAAWQSRAGQTGPIGARATRAPRTPRISSCRRSTNRDRQITRATAARKGKTPTNFGNRSCERDRLRRSFPFARKVALKAKRHAKA